MFLQPIQLPIVSGIIGGIYPLAVILAAVAVFVMGVSLGLGSPFLDLAVIALGANFVIPELRGMMPAGLLSV